MKRLLGVALGILTAIGGFVDIGDLITNALVGARFGLSLAWATLLGLVGICLYAEMSGRVAAVTGRGTFDLVSRLHRHMQIIDWTDIEHVDGELALRSSSAAPT
jgi:Mn2+/Fe2+ NRAMP family transporter